MTKKMSKTDKLKAVIRSRPKALVAFSGGVDSTLLLKVCRDVLGPGNVTAVTGVSQTYTPEELRTARRIARGLGVRHVLIPTDELACAAFAANPADRCYHCKRELFGKIAGLAGTLGLDAFYDASNVDDLSDYRPGRRATEELGVVSPLVRPDSRSGMSGPCRSGSAWPPGTSRPIPAWPAASPTGRPSPSRRSTGSGPERSSSGPWASRSSGSATTASWPGSRSRRPISPGSSGRPRPARSPPS